MFCFYLYKQEQCDTYLTRHAELERSDGPFFPEWHRARRLNSLSDVALYPKLSQLRAVPSRSKQGGGEIAVKKKCPSRV